MRRVLLSIAIASAIAGCTYDEGLEIYDIHGRVVLPEEVGFRVTDAGNSIEDDVRLIGPVYLGLYPSVQSGLREYPHPEVGPVFQQGTPGDTYPYGGTSIGDIRYACMEFLVCKVVSGRFVDFDALVEWFNDEVDQPITDALGNQVETGEYIRQTCFELMHYTTDEEIRITATQDRNDDGTVDERDLDFVQRNDGKWEADFTMYQMEFFDGFSLWGWMDAPSQSTYRFATCDPEDGYYDTEYNQEFYAGRPYRDLLNIPSQYIGYGDYVPSADPETGAYIWDDPEDVKEIELDYMVEM